MTPGRAAAVFAGLVATWAVLALVMVHAPGIPAALAWIGVGLVLTAWLWPRKRDR